MSNRIRIGDWETTIDELRRFGKTGNMTTGDERIRIDFGSAHVEVSKHGHVRTGMPLHDFEHDGWRTSWWTTTRDPSRSKLTTRPTRSDDLTGEDLTDNCTPLHRVPYTDPVSFDQRR